MKIEEQDKLIQATIKAMVKTNLPELHKYLKGIYQGKSFDSSSDAQLEKMLDDCQQMMSILQSWCGQVDSHDSLDLDGPISAEDDAELMNDMSEAAIEPNTDNNEIAENDSEDELDESDEIDEDAEKMMAAIDADQDGSDDEMSDDDAAAMLANMEADDGSSDNEEMSDDDAAAMLANMEADEGSSDNEEMSDDDAAALLANMEAEESPSDNEEMSDDDAARMLAEMEAEEPPSENEEMSDDDAARMLAEMEGGGDEPSAASEDMSDDEAARMLAEMEGSEPAATASKDMSADEEAEALLAQLGGDDEEDEEPATTAAPQAPSPAAGEFEEIDEWEMNDFQTDPDMINDFNTNADEIMENLDEVIIKLEQDPTNKELIEEIFRGAHTLKGAAGMFGFKALERVMHRMENLFDLIRKGKLNPTADIVDVVFEGLDLLRVLLEAVKNGKPCGAKTGHIVHALELVAKGEKANITRGASQPQEEAPSADAAPKAGASKDTPAKKEQSTIRVDLERLDVLVNLVGELVIDRTRFASIEEDLRTNYPQVELGGSFSETVQLFGRHMNEIQDIIMKVRMVPIGNAFNKFTRIVRDISRQLDKKIDLLISGETAELDKTLVEQIGDPLIHLIRNSCDHGIETPEVRTENGKPPIGTIMLSAHQEGNHIVIKIEDDGKGIPPDIIRRKGIEKGLISEDDVLENRDIFNLIFEPGFSTAEQVTNISGRGVGMDVVKKNIMKLKGMIEIDSELGKGTSTTIRLPLTLAIVQSLLVRSSDETFAIPLSSVIESIRISPSEIQRVGDTEVYKLRDKVLPLIHLSDALSLNGKEGSYAELLKEKNNFQRIKAKQDRLFVVVVGHADRPTGIVVDQLLNQQEMVIKSMGSLMKDIPCVAGGAVLGHGEVVLVLDIPELEESAKGRTRVAA